MKCCNETEDCNEIEDQSSISFCQLKIWMYTKCSNKLYCFWYLMLQNIYFFLKNIYGNKSICNFCWLTFFAHYYILSVTGTQ